MNSLDGKEARIHIWSLAIRVENVRRDDGGEIVNVHLAASLLINGVEGRAPDKELKEHLHGISVGLWKKTTEKVERPLAPLIIRKF